MINLLVSMLLISTMIWEAVCVGMLVGTGAHVQIGTLTAIHGIHGLTVTSLRFAYTVQMKGYITTLHGHTCMGGGGI